MRPADAGLQRDFFRGLSAESRYGRFMGMVVHAPEAHIEKLVPVDQVRHLALLAVTVEDGREVMVGEARYVVDAKDAASCELAIAVADAWQSRGIGRALLVRLLAFAAASGIRRVVAETLIGNRRMIDLGRSAGFAVRASREDRGVAVLETQPAGREACRSCGQAEGCTVCGSAQSCVESSFSGGSRQQGLARSLP
jgi:acetyltransferase